MGVCVQVEQLVPEGDSVGDGGVVLEDVFSPELRESQSASGRWVGQVCLRGCEARELLAGEVEEEVARRVARGRWRDTEGGGVLEVCL